MSELSLEQALDLLNRPAKRRDGWFDGNRLDYCEAGKLMRFIKSQQQKITELESQVEELSQWKPKFKVGDYVYFNLMESIGGGRITGILNEPMVTLDVMGVATIYKAQSELFTTEQEAKSRGK